jgi:peptide/nickel transport system permease protein
MLRHVTQQVVTVIPVLFLVSGMVFLFAHLAPGDPITALAGDQALDPEVVERLKAQYGLDRSIVVQYMTWVGNVLTGDLGYSFRTRQDVASLILGRLAVTGSLTLLATVIALSVAITSGVLAALHRGSWFDHANQLLAMIGGSMPAFWLGILLILFFSQRLELLPASGYVPWREDPAQALRHLILPAITLAAGYAAVMSRVVRASLLDVLDEDFIRTARAKGLPERQINVRHALRAALLPIITLVGVEAGHMLGGAVVTETVFALPGMGRLLVDAVNSRDFPVVQGATLVLAILLVASNLLADITYSLADPRTRRS